MFDSGSQDKEENIDHGIVAGQPAGSMPHGQIQKISQEGSKNTYVIILSKDYLKSESSQGHSLLKYSAGSGHARVSKKAGTVVAERDFDSPSGEVAVCKKKLLSPPEDVKLNLSNINDEEYDSNRSANSVFLQQDLSEDDSAIDVDEQMSKTNENSLLSDSDRYPCEKPNMKTYVIPTPVKSRKASVEKHEFLRISPLKLSEQDSRSGFSAYSPKLKTSQPGTRKVIQFPSNNDSGVCGLKKTSFCNDAVPVMGKSASSICQTPASGLPKTNPKAVPTFSDISPINQQTVSQPTKSTFIPINPADSPVEGPLTSTPLNEDPSRHKRKPHIILESTTHRPVYVIPSPFARQNSTQNPQKLDISTPGPQSSSMNNSSGFISASSSLETPDASSSFDAEKSHRSNCKYSPMETNDISSELDAEKRVSELFKCDGSGGVVITVNENGDIEELDQGIDSNSLDPSVCSSQESESSEPEKVGLNQSLTNIQWLKGMQLKDEKTSSHSQYQQQQNIHCMALSPEEIKQISHECGATKRPPFSYMSMIQMALYSRDDRKMMLKEICKWIEETFPYYKHTAKPGWRNSIRHNLSLYNIFEREPAKRHGSYWTIKSNVEPKMKQYPREKHSSSHYTSDTHRSMPTLPSQIPIIPMYSSMGQLSAVSPQTFSQSVQLPHNTAANKKKGPPPILPRPTPYSAPQAYALIPIPSVNQSFNPASPNPAQQQVLLNLPQSGQMSACPSPIISEVSAAVASIQVSSASPIPQEHFCDTASLQKEHFYNKPMNIVKQAWINCQNTETASSIDSDRLSQTDIASSSEIASSNEFTGHRTKSKRPRVKPGLPKPTLYKNEEEKLKTPGSKRRKLHQKARTLLNESSDEEEDGVKFIAKLEKEIFSKPFKSHEAEDLEHLLNTSTPAKGLSHSTTDLPSPIHGFTPLRNSEFFDNSFLDTLGDRKALGLSPEPSDLKKILQNSPRLGDSPDDFLDFNVLESPVRFEGSPGQNGNLSRILSEYGLDPGIQMDNAENFPNLNWSMVDQLVDSMDTN